MQSAPTSALRSLCASLSAALTLGLAASARAECTVQTLTEIPVTMLGSQPLVPVRINGTEGTMLLDTGAFHGVLSPAVADKLGLRARWNGVGLEGVGGGVVADYAPVRHFRLGDRDFNGLTWLLLNAADPGLAGMIGQNVLMDEDAEFDLGNGVMRLMRPKGCGPSDSLAYWAGGKAASLDMAPRDRRRDIIMSAYATLNGQRVRVQLDSGAGMSTVTLQAARRLGITPASAGVEPGPGNVGIGARVVQSWTAPFKSFAIAGEEVRNLRLGFSDSDLGDADMVLGVDFFLSHRIYVSRALGKIWFTYNGGPVFRLDQAAQAADATQPDAAAPASAGALARRGAAFIARRQYDQAIDDFTRALALEPKAADLYFDRATAEVLAKRREVAIADFDAGLALKPGDASALLARAAQRIEAGQPAGAKADLDAVAKARSGDPVFGLQIAGLYAAADQFDAAVHEYDHWLAVNPTADRVDALDGRCRARALGRLSLDQALRDCETAVRLRAGDAGILESRSLARLARGDLAQAAADAGAALKLKPKAALALQVRGLAERRLGRAAEAEADLKAARAADPVQTERLARLGFAG